MKRADITELFPDATKEQIDKLMGINGQDINEAKRGLEDVRKQLEAALAAPKDDKELLAAREKAEQLQKDLDGMKAAEAMRIMREKVAQEVGVPAALLTGGTEDECKAQAEGIRDFAKGSGYPVVRDGGEVHVDTQKTTRDQFADWFQKIQ